MDCHALPLATLAMTRYRIFCVVCEKGVNFYQKKKKKKKKKRTACVMDCFGAVKPRLAMTEFCKKFTDFLKMANSNNLQSVDLCLRESALRADATRFFQNRSQ